MNRRRRVNVLFLIFSVIIINVIVVIVVGKKIYNKEINHEWIVESYIDKSDKYRLLHSLVDEVIVENEGINKEKIPKNIVDYNIINDDENIIFEYILKETYTNEERYVATIILSDNYNILESYYSVDKVETLREIINSYTKWIKITSYCFVIFVLCCMYLVIFLICIFIYLLKLYFGGTHR